RTRHPARPVGGAGEGGQPVAGGDAGGGSRRRGRRRAPVVRGADLLPHALRGVRAARPTSSDEKGAEGGRGVGAYDDAPPEEAGAASSHAGSAEEEEKVA